MNQMEPPYPIRKKFTYPELTATTFPDGKRLYNTPFGHSPSVTTILSTLPKPGLDAWKARVGEEEARRVSKEATDIGSSMHDRLERYVGNYLRSGDETCPDPTDEKEYLAYAMAGFIKSYALHDLDEVWGIEEALYCQNLYAGRTDLIGVYRGIPSIIDYKTTKRWKIDEYLKSYRLQIAAYSVAHEQMFGIDAIEQGVILLAIRPDIPYNKSKIQRVIIGKDELQELKVEWMGVVENFYKNLSEQE